MILNDVTGDMNTYGIMTKVSKSENSISSSYEYISNGVKTSFSTQNKVFSVSSGQVVKIETDTKEVSFITSLTKISGEKISNISGSTITMGGKDYVMWDKVQIYIRKTSSQGEYNLITMDEFKQVADEYNVHAYADRAYSAGGRVRIIILS